MHSEKSAISLYQLVCAIPTWARFESSGSGTQSDPAISSITYCDQDSFYSNSLTNRERDAQSLRR